MALIKSKIGNDVYSWKSDDIRDSEISAIVNNYSAKNLLNYNDLSSQTINGVGITVNSDKSITANGTNDGTLTVLSLDSNLKFPVGTYIFSDGGYSTQFGGYVFMQMAVYGGEGVGDTSRGDITFTVSDTNTRYTIELVIAGSKTLNGTFYPMIRDTRITDNTYQSYAKTNKQLTEITNAVPAIQNVTGAKNVLPIKFDDVKQYSIKKGYGTWNGDILTYNGITYTFEVENGYVQKVTANGTIISEGRSFVCLPFNIKYGSGEYKVNGYVGNSSTYTYGKCLYVASNARSVIIGYCQSVD